MAEENAIPEITNVPFLSVRGREEEAREQRRAHRRRILRLALAAVAGLVVLHFIVTRAIYRTPSATALADHVQDLPAEMIRLYSSIDHPLQPVGATVTLTDRINWQRLRYAVEVTLRLRKPLYVPAVTNGTALYRQLQESLQTARQRDLQYNLLPVTADTLPPELPLLLQVSHRAGEKIVIRMPFEAKRLGWP